MANEGDGSENIVRITRVPILEPWPGPWAKWAMNYTRRNMWRVTTLLGDDLQDGLAECALVYVICSRMYGEKVQTPQHFMRLYQMCVLSHFATLSKKDSRMRQVAIEAPAPALVVAPVAEKAVALREASPELQEVVTFVFNAPQEIFETLRHEVSFFRAVLKKLGIKGHQAQPLLTEFRAVLAN